MNFLVRFSIQEHVLCQPEGGWDCWRTLDCSWRQGLDSAEEGELPKGSHSLNHGLQNATPRSPSRERTK